jgi:hypothetical protein
MAGRELHVPPGDRPVPVPVVVESPPRHAVTTSTIIIPPLFFYRFFDPLMREDWAMRFEILLGKGF